MKRLVTYAASCALLTMGLHAAALSSPQESQYPQSSSASPAKRTPANGVPRLIKFAGTLADTAGAPLAGTVGIQFAIYSERTGGAPLWQETQNVQLDSQGRYAVLLGAQRGFAAEIFSSNEARWLGIQVLADAEPEQGRVLLVSVPYALKAQDAETLGGRPASAYVLSETLSGASTGGKIKSTGGQAAGVDAEGNVTTTVAHTNNAIPKFSAPDTLADSMMLELYAQPALDAFGAPLGFNEDVVRLGDGTGLRKALHVIGGRVKAEGIDIATSLPNAVRVTNNAANGTSFQVNNTNTGTSFTTGVFTSVTSSSAVGFQSVVFPPATPSVPGADYTYSMVGANENPEGVTVLGWHRYTAGVVDPLPTLTGPVGIFGSVAHSSGTAGIFAYRGTGTGKIFSGLAGTTEVIGMTSAGNITTTGAVTATSFSGSGAGLTGINAGNVACTGCISISELAFDPATQAELDAHKSSGDHDGRYAQLGAANAFSMGQTINADLTLTGSINAGLRVIADPTSPILLGGFTGNTASSIGAVIGGGGASGSINQVTGNYGVVAGGETNTAGDHSAVGGGFTNTATGGSVVSGGYFNTATGSTSAVAGGGANNATGSSAFVAGGQSNTASGFVSLAAGWNANAAHDRSFVWSDGSAISSSATQQFLLQATGGVRILSGFLSDGGGLTIEPTFNTPNMILGFRPYAGGGNAATSGVTGATISGGGHSFLGGPNRITDNWGTVGGGAGNRAGDDVGDTNGTPYATVGGGLSNIASGSASGVFSGQSNTASGFNSVVGGGSTNSASGVRSTVGGGFTNAANGESSTVAGGRENTANGLYATIAGGRSHTANGTAATIAGGVSNQAAAEGATVGGGAGNAAGGTYSIVPGGVSSQALGNYAFASGRRAKATHDGSFVWADSTDADVASSANDEFTVRAGGGFRFLDSSNTLRLSISGTGAVTATSFIGDGSGLTGISASATDLTCVGCVSASEVDFNFAASASQGGPASNSLQLGGVAASDYARIATGNTFTAANTYSLIPAGASVGQGPLYVNPPSAAANTTLLGLAVAGSEKLRIDAEGDVTARSATFSGLVATAVDATASSSGVSTGVRGTSASTSGTGVRGDATAATGQTFGVHGVNSSSDGIGVLGVSNTAGSATAVGVKGALLGTAGAALYATASNPSGTAIAVHGEAVSSSALAGRFDLKANSGTILLARSGSPSLSDKFSIAADGSVTSSGSVTATSFSGSGASLTGVATSAQLAALEAKLAVRGINYIAGCDSCNLLQVADSQKAIYMNVVGAMTINQVTCISDMGAPTINLQRDDGSVGNILSADLACSTGGTSTTSFLDSALAVSDKIDFYVTGGTGVAHRVTVVIKATIN